jgi:large subunit ribosomal protein L7/L12
MQQIASQMNELLAGVARAVDAVRENKEKKQEKPASPRQEEPDVDADPVESVIETLKGMNALQLSELKKGIETTFGCHRRGAGAQRRPRPRRAAPAEAAEEKNSFKVKLDDVGANKIQVIKVVRSLTSLGLKEAKDLVDKAPSVVKEDASKEEAAKMKAELEAAGAKVSLS